MPPVKFMQKKFRGNFWWKSAWTRWTAQSQVYYRFGKLFELGLKSPFLHKLINSKLWLDKNQKMWKSFFNEARRIFPERQSTPRQEKWKNNWIDFFFEASHFDSGGFRPFSRLPKLIESPTTMTTTTTTTATTTTTTTMTKTKTTTTGWQDWVLSPKVLTSPKRWH